MIETLAGDKKHAFEIITNIQDALSNNKTNTLNQIPIARTVMTRL